MAKKSSPKKEKIKPKRKAPKINPAGIQVKRVLCFPLTDEQKATRGDEAAKFQAEHDALVLKKKKESETISSQIKDRAARVRTLLKEIETSAEEREVECTEFKNFKSNKVEFWFEGKKYGERDLTADDNQLSIEDNVVLKKSDVSKKDTTPAPTEEDFRKGVQAEADKFVKGKHLRAVAKPVRHDPVAEAHAKDEGVAREDLASVIKDETNKRSKWSATDPALT